MIYYDEYSFSVGNAHITLADGTTSDCRYWMDMVVCDTASPLFFYNHPAWNSYSAATVNKYGKGSALYLATMFEQTSLEKVLRDYFESSCPEILAHSDCHFPVIIKEGTNDFGKHVRFYFNYSGDEQHTVCKDFSGTELLSGAPVAEGNEIVLDSWGFKVIEG